jgi:hypothetical protein
VSALVDNACIKVFSEIADRYLLSRLWVL